MSSARELLELAERCEREEIPSLALNAEIARAIGWTNVSLAQVHREYPHAKAPRGCPPGQDCLTWVPPFTSSLDAAVTLVPEGAWREVNGPRRFLNIPTPVPNCWRCEITLWEPKMRDHIGWAATEALAICAAALKARAALTEQIKAKKDD